jgi:outer membrane PBP1 activator LpoA protein
MNQIKRSQLIIVAMALLSLVLTACTQTDTQSTNDAQHSSSPIVAINSMIERAQTLPSPDSERLLIDAAGLLLEQDKATEAQRVLDAINPSNLDPDTRVKLVMQMALTALHQDQPLQAEELLTTDRMGLLTAANQLNAEQLNAISLLRAEAWEATGNFLSAARERIFVAPMLMDEAESTANHHRIWNNLIAIPIDTLKQLSATVAVPKIQGWLELAWIYKGLQDDLDQQLKQLAVWQQRFPAHPAGLQLPEALRIISELSDSRPTQIALLLPTQGKYKLAAEAIRNGFMGAHYAAQANNLEHISNITIRIYDTSNAAAFLQTYSQAVNDGAEIIIGPLQKENLRALLTSTNNLPVNTIALNREIGQFESPANLYQFGLSPEDDAEQVAAHAKTYQFQNAAVLYQNNPWWERAYAEFTRHWIADQRTVTGVASFENQEKMANAIREMLLVHYSEQRAQQLKRITGKKLEFQPRRRQDIDFIYLISTPEQARQIRPLLDFYYAEDIPVIAGSQIYSGKPSPKKDRDLNGIEFCDIPWLLEKPDAIQQAMINAWPKADHRYFRFNAMGVDAYRLQSRLQLLTQIPDAGLFGATGNLSIGIDNKVHRGLSWAVIKNGKPTLLPKPIDTEVMESNQDLQPIQGHHEPNRQNANPEAHHREKTNRKPS